MDFRFSPEEEAFRLEIRTWLKGNLPENWEGAAGFARGRDEENASIYKDFAKKLATKKWVAPHWPAPYGGLGLSVIQQLIYNEEMAYANAPIGYSSIGVGWAGPTIIVYGTEEQKQKHLSAITNAETMWCQGFSEPNAGSDLANISTKAVRDGDDYILNGQKIWTSGAHRSNWGWIAARTDFEAPKHKGISMFLMPMDAPGISIRPLINMAGQHGFNEVFLEDVRIPAKYLVGQENMGWYQLAVALDFERSSIAGSARARRILDEYVRYAHENKAAVDGKPEIRNRLAEISIEIDIAKYLSYRVASLQQSGKIPNYEATIAKLYSSELGQRLSNTGMQLLGLYGQIHPRSKYARIKGLTERYYQMSVAETIAGGTSEVMRTVGAIRGLGLPRG
jgi:alkylation response protein AidB-like acyl-CoA dehydrogenase